MIGARHKICLALFLALSFGVLVNILALQPDIKPKTTSSGAGHSLTAGSAAVAQLTVAAPIISDIRTELERLGYLPRSNAQLDGLSLHAAIMNFEVDAGLEISASADDALLARLLLQPLRPPAKAAKALDLPAASQAAAVVRAIQTALTRRGYTVARVDGRLTEETLRAIREFEMDRGLSTSGSVSAALLHRLRDAQGRG